MKIKMKKSKKDKVLEILRRDGKIDNFDLVHGTHGFISLRGSDLIFQLKQEGKIEIDEEKSGFIGDTKNYRYIIKPLTPKSVERFVVKNGNDDGTDKVIERVTW